MKNKKLAVVIGASTGIGYEMTKLFAQNGYDLYIVANDRRIAKIARALQELGTNVQFRITDLTQRENVILLHHDIRSLESPVESLAINAGLNLNIISTMLLTKLIAKDMIGNREGRIFLTSPIAASVVNPYSAMNIATTDFVESFAQALRDELETTGLTVSALLPDSRSARPERLTPGEVAQQSFEALMNGRGFVFATPLADKIEASFSRILGSMADRSKLNPDVLTTRNRGTSQPQFEGAR